MASARTEIENVFRTVVKRCVECLPQTPSCAGLNCPSGQMCIQQPTTCDACSSVVCAIDPTFGDSSASKPNVGAIAGGVIGGVLFIATLTFIVWKYCLKGKRRQRSEVDWQEAQAAEQEKAQDDFESRRSARASTHTVASMASSVLTRASNIIQIAYIPGVTNRSGVGSPDLLVPPVPPIPALSHSSANSPYLGPEQHFFVPDFRDSMASTSTGGRQSMAPSFARNSVASTMYRQNAIVSPLPAQTVVRGKAAVVSVKSGGSNSPESLSPETPPVPQIDPRHAVKPIRIQMPGINPGNSARTIAQLGPVRALNITKKKGSDATLKSSAASTPSRTPDIRLAPPRPLTDFSVASSDDGVTHARARKAGSEDYETDSDDEDHVRSRRSLMRNSASTRDSNLIDLQYTPTNPQSPFSDSSAIDSLRPSTGQSVVSYDTNNTSPMPMASIAEETSKRARDRSPFADSNRADV
ncbi:hypothetical protein P153DRAFT_372374 [Dothidotthia symphoricarpi CBS 119687]|uniref:Membrane anchor Opy2 N-terminal domain-containing protein n=1 Tax=Dothidotthia symphoricarpi CBS 119687 TaxID=1392245 RepID=A0A6A6AP85_9PLEO|nr:uncharacterized protein P153DRAFT_372374 [Dothidotthia symphoricarpi CBS 119687]KAF2133812.1 hypothetical protein P153DRAFT_372374 [Dothidotthia symphoricarpi CBS 119687]